MGSPSRFVNQFHHRLTRFADPGPGQYFLTVAAGVLLATSQRTTRHDLFPPAFMVHEGTIDLLVLDGAQEVLQLHVLLEEDALRGVGHMVHQGVHVDDRH